MPVNKEHLLKIKAHILEEPNRLDMAHWFVNSWQVGEKIFDAFCNNNLNQKIPRCGTVGCIAGWSAQLRGVKFESSFDEADFLNLPNGGKHLFMVSGWPPDLDSAYRNATSVREKAELAGKAIDLIIEGDGTFPFN